MARVRIKKSKVHNPAVPNQTAPFSNPVDMQTPKLEARRVLKSVPREDANIEAEKGETVYFPDKGGLPAHFNIEGNRHVDGGTPLNVPKDSFVFSDTRKMRIKDPDILALFGKSKGSYTPADLAKKYDINKFRQLLQDPNSDKIEIETAEKMIANYNLKLGKLALVQESKKGFPQGIPAIAMPYLATYSIEPDSILPFKPQEGQGEAPPEEEPETEAKFGGNLPKAQFGFGYGNRRVRVIPPGGVPYNYRGYTQYDAPWNTSDINIAQNTTRNYNTGSSTTTTKKVTPKGPPVDAEVIEYDPATKTSDQVIEENKARISNSKSPVYLKTKDGKYEQIVRTDTDITTYNSDVFNTAKHGKMYEYIKRTLTAEKNKKMIDKMYENYKKHINDSTDLTPESKAELLKKSPDEVLSNFLEAQKHVLKIKESGADLQKDIAEWNTEKQGKNKKYKDTMAALKLTPLKDTDIAGFQAAYKGFQDLSDDPDAADLKNFDMQPIGAQRTAKHKYKDKTISAVDDLFGAATAGQTLTPKHEFAAKPVEGEDATEETKNTAAAANYVTGRKPAPFWLQDMINMAGAAGTRLGLKKYMPWAPKLEPRVPEAYYPDPTRELAANAEQMRIGTEGAGIFSGPQAYNARFSQIQGAGARNAANILARYNNESIGIANKFSALKADIYNKADQTNAAVATDLYNKTTIANQQFDNAKRQANNEMRGALVNAITNRAQAQTLNMMYPHFQVDPRRGGFLDFYKGDEVIPGSENSAESRLKQMQDWKSVYPGWDDSTYAELAGLSETKKKRDPASDWEAYKNLRSGT